MKKILLASTIPLSLNVFSLGLSFMRYLREKGYEIHAAAGPGKEGDFIRAQGIVYHEIYIARTINIYSDIKAFCSFIRLLKQEQFDLVHTQTSKAGFLGRLAAWIVGVPLVIHTAHNWPFHELLPFRLRYFYLLLERIAACWCDKIIVDTIAVLDYGIQHRVAAPKKIKQIYMGIDLERFYPYSLDRKQAIKTSIGIRPEQKVIGAISRLVPDKGIETFIECAKAFRDNPNIVFVLGGDGPLRKECERQVSLAGMSENVFFLGHLDDVVPYLNAFDVFFLPTLREGFGVIFAEAGACGVPVVASDIAPLREVIDPGKNGFLVGAKDTDAFVKALTLSLRQETYQRMSD